MDNKKLPYTSIFYKPLFNKHKLSLTIDYSSAIRVSGNKKTAYSHNVMFKTFGRTLLMVFWNQVTNSFKIQICNVKFSKLLCNKHMYTYPSSLYSSDYITICERMHSASIMHMDWQCIVCHKFFKHFIKNINFNKIYQNREYSKYVNYSQLINILINKYFNL